MIKNVTRCVPGLLCLSMMMGAVGPCPFSQDPFERYPTDGDPSDGGSNYPGSSYLRSYGVSRDPNLSDYDSYYDDGYEDGYRDGFNYANNIDSHRRRSDQCDAIAWPDSCWDLRQYVNGYVDGNFDGYWDAPQDEECNYGHITNDYRLTVSNRFPMPDDDVTVYVTKLDGCFPNTWYSTGGKDNLEIEVIGTDGYYDHDTMYGTTGGTCVWYDSRGNQFTYRDTYYHTIPGADAGVKDVIRVKVPGEDGDPDTILCIAIYFDVAQW